MNLLTLSQTRAAEIAETHKETITFLRAQAKRSYHLLTTAPNPQEVLDAFGKQAVRALQTYIAIRSALVAINEEADLPDADLTIFQPQPDGTVIYTPIQFDPEQEDPPNEP